MPETKSNLSKPVFIGKENKFRVYSNHSGVATTNFDITLLFGEIESASGSELTVLQHGSVTMSPHHAKAFSISLSNAVQQYEEKFGVIKLPDHDALKSKK